MIERLGNEEDGRLSIGVGEVRLLGPERRLIADRGPALDLCGPSGFRLSGLMPLHDGFAEVAPKTHISLRARRERERGIAQALRHATGGPECGQGC